MKAGDPVDRLKGIGPKTADALAALGIRSVVDLMLHLPKRYEDRGSIVPIRRALESPGRVLLRGRVTVALSRYIRRRMHITDGLVTDSSGSMPIRWFNQPWIADRVGEGTDAYLFGAVVDSRSGRRQLVNPEMEMCDASSPTDAIVPVYSRLGPLAGKRLRTAIEHALECLGTFDDPVPEDVLEELALPGLHTALVGLHRPQAPTPESRKDLVAALNDRRSPGHRRLAFDELLAVSSVVADARGRRRRQKAYVVESDIDPAIAAREIFDFALTGAQRRACAEIVADLAAPTPMARLLQGDVGSGKTAVAIIAVDAVARAGLQTAVMAPTEILAEQLHGSLAAALAYRGVSVSLLTGSMSGADAGAVVSGLAEGSIDVVVGTHALFSERVVFSKIGLVVIDEQHRFGVTQRQRLLDKGRAPHLLVMTATPIPRSLALTIYGDLDVTIIDELPPGRRPVRTEIRSASARGRVLDFLRREIADGGRAFIVCPTIDRSAEGGAVSLEEIEPLVRQRLPDVEVAVLHGRMGRDEREAVAARFRAGDVEVLLATTIIEVGVDVPQASVMVIESADRFGLSQLHQLRGRVGRGERASWCILVTGDDPTDAGRRRLEVLATTSDGFAIAEADLEQRGAGELAGVRQWGADSFRFADLADVRTAAAARRAAARLAVDGRLTDVRRRLLAMQPVAAGVFSVA